MEATKDGTTSPPQKFTTDRMKSDTKALEAAIQSLPLYVPGSEQKTATVSPDVSYMIAVQDDNRHDPAMVMSGELVDAIVASTSAGLEAIYQSDLAKQKRNVILEFQQWAEIERNEVLISRHSTHNPRARSARLRKLDEDLEQAEQEIREIDEPVSEARHESYKANLFLLGILHEVFENHALIEGQDERFENLKPDDEFLNRWKIPEPEQPEQLEQRSNDGANTDSKGKGKKPRTPSPPPGRSRSSHISSATDGSRGRAPERPRSRSSSPRRDGTRAQPPSQRRYRSRSPPQDRSGSLTPRGNRSPAQSANNQQDPSQTSPQQSRPPRARTPLRSRNGRVRSESPYRRRARRESPYEPVSEGEKARRDFYAYAEELRKAQADFDKRHEMTQFPSDRYDSTEVRHPFAVFKELNRIQVKAEDKFREARRRCIELGVDILYDAQTSCFPPDDGAEDEQRALFARFVGPQRYPQVQQWLDGLPADVADEAVLDSQPSELAETDEWEPRPWIDYDDCWSAVAVGAGKGRIRTAQTTRDDLRQEAKEHWAKVLNISKADWNGRHWG